MAHTVALLPDQEVCCCWMVYFMIAICCSPPITYPAVCNHFFQSLVSLHPNPLRKMTSGRHPVCVPVSLFVCVCVCVWEWESIQTHLMLKTTVLALCVLSDDDDVYVLVARLDPWEGLAVHYIGIEVQSCAKREKREKLRVIGRQRHWHSVKMHPG